jgi:hypothetical protein
MLSRRHPSLSFHRAIVGQALPILIGAPGRPHAETEKPCTLTKLPIGAAMFRYVVIVD